MVDFGFVQIKKAGCNVLLVQKSILRDAYNDLSIHFLAKVRAPTEYVAWFLTWEQHRPGVKSLLPTVFVEGFGVSTPQNFISAATVVCRRWR